MDYFCTSWIQDNDLSLWERAYQVLLKEADFYQVMFPEGGRHRPEGLSSGKRPY